MSTEFRTSHMRCAPGYRHNDITVLIIGKANTPIVSDPRRLFRLIANNITQQ